MWPGGEHEDTGQQWNLITALLKNKTNNFFVLCCGQSSPGIGVRGGYWLDLDTASALLCCWLGRARAAVGSRFWSDFITGLLQRHLTLSTGYSCTVFIVLHKKWLKYRMKCDRVLLSGRFWVLERLRSWCRKATGVSSVLTKEDRRGKGTSWD